MQAFSISSEYISDLIAGLNLTPATAMSASVPNPAPASASNATLPSTTSEFYNAARAISAFSVTVKPAFTKYLEETRKNSTKRVTQDKYDDLVSWLTDLNRKARTQAERNAKSKANLQWFIREDIYLKLQGL